VQEEQEGDCETQEEQEGEKRLKRAFGLVFSTPLRVRVFTDIDWHSPVGDSDGLVMPDRQLVSVRRGTWHDRSAPAVRVDTADQEATCMCFKGMHAQY
jgi:hypothetical protein